MTRYGNHTDLKNEYPEMNFRNLVNILLAGLVIAGLAVSMTFNYLNFGQLSPFNIVLIAPIILANLSIIYFGIETEVENKLFASYIGISFTIMVTTPVILTFPSLNSVRGIQVLDLLAHVLLILLFGLHLWLRLCSRTGK